MRIMATPFHSIEDAIRDIKQGKLIILVDDEDRENEGDLVMAAQHVTPQAVNFMARHARGLICLALTPQRVEELHLPQQAVENTATFGTAFTVSIDARKDIRPASRQRIGPRRFMWRLILSPSPAIWRDPATFFH